METSGGKISEMGSQKKICSMGRKRGRMKMHAKKTTLRKTESGSAILTTPMPVSWGAMGFMWGKPSVTVYIRPQRYTKEFVDTRDTFTLSFYPAEKKDALSYLGKVSGRDEDKVKKVGFTPAFTNGNAYFEEAELVLVCRKMSRTPLRPEQFLDETVDGRWYPDKDYHEMYIAEVIDVLVKES